MMMEVEHQFGFIQNVHQNSMVDQLNMQREVTNNLFSIYHLYVCFLEI